MPNTLKPKRSSTAGLAPTTSNLASGEIAVNMADRRIYINNGTAVVQVGAGVLSALGDVSLTSLTSGQTLQWNGTAWVNSSAGSGTVTSVAVSVPTGLSVSGSPVTTSGTIAISLASGYSIPTTASQTNWDSAFSERRQWDGGSANLVAATGRTSLGATTVGSNLFTLTNPSAVTFLRLNADNTVSALDAATFRSAIGAGTSSTTGTVTSVALSLPAIFSVSGSPVTSSGTLSASLASQTANTVWAAPNGSAGAPTFRALVAGDIPSITLEKVPDAWVKRSVRVATTANITLSGTQTIDGIAVVAGDRVLVKDQSTSAQNGIYVVAAGSWSRAADADVASELAAASVAVDSGTANGGFSFDTDFKSTDTLGTTAMSWARVMDTGLASSTTPAAAGTAAVGTSISYARADHVHPLQTTVSGNAGTATALQTGRTIGMTGDVTWTSASFNGSANVTGTATLASSGVTAGTYTNATITVDAKGRVTSASSGSGGGVTSFNTRTGAITLTSSDVTTALGFTPYDSTNPSGYITSAALSSYLPLSGGTLTGRTIVNTTGRAFTVGGSPAGTPNATVATQTAYLEIAAGAGGNTNSSGLIFHNPNVSTSVLEYVNTTADNAYFNFRSDDASWDVRVNGNQVLHAGNFSSYSPSLTGSGASGTWGINVTGSAGSVAWTNVSGRPTALSSFTNDSGYITSSALSSYLPLSGGTLTGDLFMAGTNSRLPGHFYTNTHDGFNVYFHVGTATSTEKVLNLRVFKANNDYATYVFDSAKLNAPNLQINGSQVLHLGNYTAYTPSLSGTGASGTWSISVSGFAATLQTGRTISMTGDVTYTSGSFNGSANVTGTATIPTASVTGKVLTGYAVGTNTALAATDTILGAFGKVQAQINAKGAGTVTSVGGTGTVSGLTLTGTVTGSGNLTLGGAITGFLPSTGGTVTGTVTLSSAAPILVFAETDQTLPAGRRRLVLDGNLFTLRRNTAAAGDFSTETNDFTIDASSNFAASGNVTAYSDERLKTNWRDLPADLVDRLAGVKHGIYDRRDLDGLTQVGVSAQSLQAVLAQAVMTNDNGLLSVNYGSAALVSAVALAQRVIQLEARIAELELKAA